MAQTLTIKGERHYLLDEAEYRQLTLRALPRVPKPSAAGTVPALKYARSTLARKIHSAMISAGMNQAGLARKAGVRPETINRILKGRQTPDQATLVKIDKALKVRPSSA